MARFFTAIASFLTLACVQPAATHAQSLPQPNSIGGDRVHVILPRDAIPSIDQPSFVRASEATFMRADEPVLGVIANGVAKAYSTWHLDHHEIVNDTLAGKPVGVTW